MSLVPYIVNELLSELDRPSYDNHFFQPYERLTVAPLRAGYLRPWRHHHQNESGVSSVANDKDGFKISLDVQQFKPEELNVKVSCFIFLEMLYIIEKTFTGSPGVPYRKCIGFSPIQIKIFLPT